jgi:hypothetical protein
MFRVHSGRALIGCLVVCLAVGTALAARPRPPVPVARVRVRVGDHPGFTRVVFDSPARLQYKIGSRSARLLAVVFEGAVLNRPLVSGGLGERQLVRAVMARPRADQPTVLIQLAVPARRKVKYLVNRPGADPSRRHQLIIDLYPRRPAKTSGRVVPTRQPGPTPATPAARPPDVEFLARGTPKPPLRVAPLPLPAPISPPSRSEPTPPGARPVAGRPAPVKPATAGPPPAAAVKKPAVVASLPRKGPWPPTQLKIPAVPVQPRLRPAPRLPALRPGSEVLALAQWKCSSHFGHWAIVYRGRLTRLDPKWALVKLERRYGYRYRPRQKGIDRSNWWCVPRRRHCYKAVSFTSWNGRYQPGLVVRFPRRQVVSGRRRIEGGVARLLDRRCRVGRAAAAPTRVKPPRRATGSGRP